MNNRGKAGQGVADLLGVTPERLIGGLNLVDASQLLGIAPSTLRQRAFAGDIGHQRDGRSWRFFWWHLGDYVMARERAASVPSSGKSANRPMPSSTEAGHDLDAEARNLGLL